MTFTGFPIKTIPIALTTVGQSQQTALSGAGGPGTNIRMPILPTAVAAVGGTRFRIAVADHQDFPGTPQWRIVGSIDDDVNQSGESFPATGDSLTLTVIDAVTPANTLLTVTAIVAAPGGVNTVTVLRSAWANIPTLNYCYLGAANTTAARGAIIEAHYEVRWV